MEQKDAPSIMANYIKNLENERKPKIRANKTPTKKIVAIFENMYFWFLESAKYKIFC